MWLKSSIFRYCVLLHSTISWFAKQLQGCRKQTLTLLVLWNYRKRFFLLLRFLNKLWQLILHWCLPGLFLTRELIFDRIDTQTESPSRGCTKSRLLSERPDISWCVVEFSRGGRAIGFENNLGLFWQSKISVISHVSVYKGVRLVTLAVPVSVKFTDSFRLTILRINDCKNRSHLQGNRVTLEVKFILVRDDMHMHPRNLIEFEHFRILCPDCCLGNARLVYCC